MRLRLGLVSEANTKFLNQVKLLLYSFRKNAGALSGIPVTLITNSEALCKTEADFFRKHFSPIEFQTGPRLGAIPHTSKLNVFYTIDPSSYDILLYMDCDTVVRKPLDLTLDPIVNEGAEFVCRRGGKTDRGSFVDFGKLVSEYCGHRSNRKVYFDGEAEWPMFNSGVFLTTSDTVRKIRRHTIEFTYSLFNEWQRINAVETQLFMRVLLKLKLIRSRQKVVVDWPLEQGAIALACIREGVAVQYLDEIYNSWGNLDFHVLHCFKSAYRFDRATMYSADAENWLEEYGRSELTGKVFLSNIIREFKADIDV